MHPSLRAVRVLLHRKVVRRASILGLVIGVVFAACGGSSPAAPSAMASSGASGQTSPAAPGTMRVGDDFGGRTLFPSDNWWNQDVSRAPVDPQSSAYIAFIGESRGMHPDFGPPPYGIPYIGVENQPLVPVTFTAYGSESDAGFRGEIGYPIPDLVKTQPGLIEGGVPGGGTSGDRHLLIVDRTRWVLFELFAARWNASLDRWEASSGAVFDLSSNVRRQEGWTSADASGLAILPGLVRYDEAAAGPVRHALRVTVRATNGFVWPASHRAGSTGGALPMGARLRLKAGKDLSGYPRQVQNIFRGMQTHGLIVADNGSDLFVTGATDPRWSNNELNPAFRSLTAADFEVIELGWR
jgi:hypothetical protein